MTTFKQRMIRAFGAAERYNSHALIQQQVAAALARRIAVLPPPAQPRILEVGCGTGFLAGALPPPEGTDWLMTDVSPAMVERSRNRFGGQPGYRFAVLDAENPRFVQPETGFDLICSSLAAQWFVDLGQALQRLFDLLKPGGRMLVSTLARGTFAEWRAAHAACGFVAGTPGYPDRTAFEAIQLGGQQGSVDVEHFLASYRDGRDFLRTLRAIGAATPRSGHQPLNPRAMQAVLRAFEEGGAAVTYEVAFCAFVRPEASAP